MYNDALVSLISGGVGIAMSFLFGFVPQLREWYYSLPETQRGPAMIGFLAITSVLLFGSSCLGLFVFASCDLPGGMELARAFVIAAITNQTTWPVVKPKVKELLTRSAKG